MHWTSHPSVTSWGGSKKAKFATEECVDERQERRHIVASLNVNRINGECKRRITVENGINDKINMLDISENLSLGQEMVDGDNEGEHSVWEGGMVWTDLDR